MINWMVIGERRKSTVNVIIDDSKESKDVDVDDEEQRER